MEALDLFKDIEVKKFLTTNNLTKEIEYSSYVNLTHIKKYNQYFTNYKIAEFMVRWCCKEAKQLLDPCVGNSVFLKFAKKIYPKCQLFGYEIDKKILDFFGNPSNAKIKNDDYLQSDWNEYYDAIVCNPPYSRFQNIPNRYDIIDDIKKHTGVKCSTYTNLYILFLIKCIHQLSNTGRLAFIIPSEFLNSKYGNVIKEFLLKNRLLNTIINFNNDKNIFFNATTTCCIILLDKSIKNKIYFYNLNCIDDLDKMFTKELSGLNFSVSYEDVSSTEKWRKYLKQENKILRTNLKKISDFCHVSRGIATGANDFFCFNKSKIIFHNIPTECLLPCICHSCDIKNIIFSNQEFDNLITSDKFVYVLNVSEFQYELVSKYLASGTEQNIHTRYLLSHRKPWFTLEDKEVAPIWVSSAYRGNIKFIRNTTNSKNLTTFHSMYINKEYIDYTDIIFCYFLTPTSQRIIAENRKELGNGLKKFQPNDLNESEMIDITTISKTDKYEILKIYNLISQSHNNDYINKLDEIFKKYCV